MSRLTLSYNDYHFVFAALDAAWREDAPQDALHTQRNPDAATPFHSSSVPNVLLHDYVHHMATNSGYGVDGLAMAIGITGRYVKTAGVCLSAYTMHRVVAVAMQIGMKATDIFVKNCYFADMAGIPLREFNRLEVEMLLALGFRGVPSYAEVVTLAEGLFAVASQAHHEGRVPSGADMRAEMAAFATHATAESHPFPAGSTSGRSFDNATPSSMTIPDDRAMDTPPMHMYGSAHTDLDHTLGIAPAMTGSADFTTGPSSTASLSSPDGPSTCDPQTA